MSRLILLTGAPETHTLDWSEQSLLPLKAVAVGIRSVTGLSSTPSCENFAARWRQVASEVAPMRPFLSKLEIDSPDLTTAESGATTFFSAHDFIHQDLSQDSAGSDISAEDSRPSQDSSEYENDALSEFYDHSFSIYEAVPSSQLETPGYSGYTPGTPTYESSDDMFALTTTTPGGIIRTPSGRSLTEVPRPKTLSNLEDVPNALHLAAIRPQTMTVNLVVGILSISPARTVMTGLHYGRPREVDLVEMTVADDTKSGFSVSMWLPREMRVNWKDGAQEKPEGARSLLRRNLKQFRPRDIVLLQNVALSSFRGQVHGQSLRGDVTKADLLFRRKVDDDDCSGVYSVQHLRMATGKDAQIMKVKRVRDWMMEFVGEPYGARPGKRGRRRMHALPDDTQ